MKWFKHFSNASSSESLEDLINDLGFDGYGRYWRLLEFLSDLFDGETTFFRIHKRTLRTCLRFKSATRLRCFVDTIATQRGYTVNETENHYEIDAHILLDLKDRDFKKARKVRDEHAPKIKIKNKDIDIDILKGSDQNGTMFQKVQTEWNNTLGYDLVKAYVMPCGNDIDNFKTSAGYLPDISDWQSLFEKCKNSKLYKKPDNFQCEWFSLSWLLDPNNAAKVMNGTFDMPKESEEKQYADL